MLEYEDVPCELRSFFADHPRVALAFSGGCDSAYLFACALACKVKVHAYLVHSQFQYGFELDDAYRVARSLGTRFQIIELDVLSDKAITANPQDRCYFCKRLMFKTILDHAQRDGFDTLIDGTNATDNPDRRPGFRAISEYGVLSPLRLANLTKEEIRDLSRKAGLITADKPNYSCLATRIPEGERITEEKLQSLSQEDWLDRTKEEAGI